MQAETDLRALLRGLSPQLREGAYVYTIVRDIPPAPVVFVREDEGLTLILPQQQADDLGVPYDFVAGWITLQVHSALTAIGLTAAVSRVLTDVGISANVVAGFTHDHLFVPHHRADDAVRTLAALAASS
ncbi:MAG: ACT domain-containing protein [Actinobacteria bacterium]|nr:ACT domain-containing protein [Actinomycetota bacterium]